MKNITQRIYFSTTLPPYNQNWISLTEHFFDILFSDESLLKLVHPPHINTYNTLINITKIPMSRMLRI